MDAETVFKDYFDVELTFERYDSGVIFFNGNINDMYVQLIIDTTDYYDSDELYFDIQTGFTIEDYFNGSEWESGVVVRVYEGDPDFATSTLVYSSGETRVDDVYGEYDTEDGDILVDVDDFDIEDDFEDDLEK